MSTSEIKTEIHKVLDNVPENVLQSVLDYLKSIIHTDSDSVHQNCFFYNQRKRIASLNFSIPKIVLS